MCRVLACRFPRLADAMKEFSDDPRVDFVLDLKDPSVNPYELRKTIGGLSTNRFVLFGTQACMNSLPNVEKENKGKNLYTRGRTAWCTEKNIKREYLFYMNSEYEFAMNWIVEILVLPALFLNQDLIDDAHVVNCKVLAYGIDERRPF